MPVATSPRNGSFITITLSPKNFEYPVERPMKDSRSSIPSTPSTARKMAATAEPGQGSIKELLEMVLSPVEQFRYSDSSY